jgi:hypothetical protein
MRIQVLLLVVVSLLAIGCRGAHDFQLNATITHTTEISTHTPFNNLYVPVLRGARVVEEAVAAGLGPANESCYSAQAQKNTTVVTGPGYRRQYTTVNGGTYLGLRTGIGTRPPCY